MGYISDEKLYSSFNRVNTLELDYVNKAKEIAKIIAEGGEPDVKDLAYIRACAVNDRKNLKGDFVISCLLDLIEENKFNRWERGKRVHITDIMIEKIFRNHFSKGSITDFCKDNPIDRNKYYRVRDNKFKDYETKERVQAIKDRIAKEFEM